MRMILPEPGDELDDFELAEAYAYPRERWLRANMVTSADGAGSLDGLSGGLSAAGDKRVFGMLRVLADVVLVGSGTAEAENYKPARPRPALASLRAGRPATATIAVISGSLDLDLATPLFTDAPPDARTIVITREAARPDLRAAAAKVADVIVAGRRTRSTWRRRSRALADRGLRRVNCEGGPHLLAQIAAAGLLDELTLTVSPDPGRARRGPHRRGRRLRRPPDDPGPGADRGRLPLLPVPRSEARRIRIRRYQTDQRRSFAGQALGAELLSEDLSVTLEHMESEGSVPDAHEVAAALRVAIGMLYRRLKQTSPNDELTLAESSTLSRLERGGPASSSELARHDRISPQSMGVTVAALEDRGLIERDRDPGDGRRIVLSITEAGRQLIHDKRGARTGQIAAALATGSAATS